MTKKILSGLSAVVLSFGFVLPVSALDVTGTVQSTTNGAVQVGGSNGSAGAGVNANVNANVNGQASSTGSSGTQTGADTAVSSETNVQIDAEPLFITRADVEARANTSGAAAVHADAVKTKADLSSYVAAEMKGDANIDQVKASASNVAVTYKQRAKLFGFIPVTVNATANVEADGSVKVSYPWYVLFAATNKADLEAKLQQRVNADLSAAGTAGAQASAETDAAVAFSTAQQAKLISDMKALMQDEFEASVSASATGSASVQ